MPGVKAAIYCPQMTYSYGRSCCFLLIYLGLVHFFKSTPTIRAFYQWSTRAWQNLAQNVMNASLMIVCEEFHLSWEHDISRTICPEKLAYIQHYLRGSWSMQGLCMYYYICKIERQSKLMVISLLCVPFAQKSVNVKLRQQSRGFFLPNLHLWGATKCHSRPICYFKGKSAPAAASCFEKWQARGSY